MSSSLVFNRVYRLEIQSDMLVFSTPLVNCCPYTFSLTYPTPPPLPKVNVQYIQTVCVCGGMGGGGADVELCCRPYSKDFNQTGLKCTEQTVSHLVDI
jgi:hypothetical protein